MRSGVWFLGGRREVAFVSSRSERPTLLCSTAVECFGSRLARKSGKSVLNCSRGGSRSTDLDAQLATAAAFAEKSGLTIDAETLAGGRV